MHKLGPRLGNTSNTVTPEISAGLWNESYSSYEQGNEGAVETYLIDWDGFPSDYPAFPRILDFLTPFDWALGFRTTGPMR